MTSQSPILTKGRLATLIVVAILLIDQAIKIWVKTSMCLHESIQITDWFYITFIENMGMAFGMQLGSKILLSLFRVVAIAGLTYYIWLEVKRKSPTGYIVCLAMILAGAAGNLIDCLFYGLIFNESSEDGTKVSVRPSGTEPKIKFYTEVKDPSFKDAADYERCIKAAEEKIEALKKSLNL